LYIISEASKWASDLAQDKIAEYKIYSEDIEAKKGIKRGVAILITGGAGYVGARLARRLLERDETLVLFDVVPITSYAADLKDKAKIIQGDLAVWAEVFNVVKENNVDGIFHLGAMLGVPSEVNPWSSFQANVMGTMHVLEAARLFEVKRVVFASSTATYDLGITGIVTDETIQRPVNMYGAGKVYGELLGRFYRRRFDLDFRCLRYCAVTGPGVRSKSITNYNSWMIENAALDKPYECLVTEDAAIPIIYFKDAIRATLMLYDAPKEQIKTVCYNVSGVSPARTAKELEIAIKKIIPEAKIAYKPDPLVVEFFQTLKSLRGIDDSRAREEWGWEPLYSDFDKLVADFIQEVRTKPQLYGLVYKT